MRHAVALAGVIVAGLGAVASAESRAPAPTGGAVDDDVVTIDVGPTPQLAEPVHTIFLNRCVGGCTVRPGSNDSTQDTSSLILQTAQISAFKYSDTTWNAMVDCVTKTYAPYDVQIVTTRPASSVGYTEAIVAGTPDEINAGPTTLGLSPMASDCSAGHDWISFILANAHGDDALDICATVAHETGHVFGLDHTIDCKDPMTYLTGCGEKYFLNLPMQCGEFNGARPCKCNRPSENTHVLLTNLLGAGTLPPPPQVAIAYPADAATVDSKFPIVANVTEDRVVDRVEFWINGFPWGTLTGSRTASQYSFTTPASLPDGVLHVEVRGYDDLQQAGSATETLQKGASCTTAATCLDGQSCNAGACEWPAPTLMLGDECTRDADCTTFKCASDGTVNLCSQLCVAGVDGSCPTDFTCLQAGDKGECWPNDRLGGNGGCCDAGGSGAPLGSIALGALVAAMATRRRARFGR